MLPMELSFRKLLGERFAFSGYFCPLRYAVHVKEYFNLYELVSYV